ncbi:MAG: DUF3429 domain-containing protein [Parvularculaceae bacterium]|nr:DUF3429 domain-containing protein [Parvularculaceae bacterium]
MRQNEELATRLGLYGLVPFFFGAVTVWASPLIVPQWVALNIHSLTLAYAGVIAAWVAGVGAGAALMSARPTTENLAPGILAALVAWFAIWPGGFLTFSMPVVWRYLLLIILFGYLLVRDLRAVSAGDLPSWYGPLRMRLTLWTCVSLALIMSRLILWRFY